MYFFYNGYIHDDNSVAFESIQRVFIRGSTQRAHLLRVSWAIKGKIVDPIQANIWAKLATMITAYNVDGGSAGLNGTPFQINGNVAIGGVRVTQGVSHNGIQGAEGTTYLNYRIGLQADFLWSGPRDVLEYRETLSFTDNLGGPIYVERIPATGPPILQQVTESSWYFVTQSGSLSQSGPNPPAVPPAFALSYLRTGGNAARSLTYSSPKTIRGVPVEYGVQWKYEFISDSPLVAFPAQLG